ncbi:metal transporter [Amycolatopsis suaedae]|uniref:Metal transporter n=1 Tax=Amycolatopsis suaedae TaxID=2510978 RepID=A0A4Q7J0V9_9PSEU|nr:metal transporter [Amycolatopsis suaedae]RZQ60991.1 metal transporter [Amycolatopsis suaedae]
MNSAKIATRPVDVGMGVVFAMALAVTAYLLADSWGGGYWVFGCTTGAVVCVLAMTWRHRMWAAPAGLVVAATAIPVASVAGLPAEPGPGTALGLSVLVGSAIRTLGAPGATAVAAGGLAIVAGTWLTDGATAVAMLNSVGWLAALVIGLWPRLAGGKDA